MVKINANTKVRNKKDEKEISISPEVIKIHGITGSSTDEEHPNLSLKYYDFNFKCFSELEKSDLKAFTELTRKFSHMTWRQVMSQASKGKGKRGLAPTIIERKALPNTQMINAVSDEIPIFELRLSSSFRVFGFRSLSTFFMILLDPNHSVTN